MARMTPAHRLTAGALPLIALLSCGGSHDAAAPTPASTTAAPPASGTPPTPAPATAATTAPTPTRPAAATPQTAIATVNGVPVTAEKVQSVYRMNRAMLEQRGRTLSEADDQALKTQSLQAVLADELMFQAAVARGIGTTGPAVDAAVNQLKQRAGSPAAYEKLLANSGLTQADVRTEVERNLRTDAFRKTLIGSKTVSEEEAKKYYDANAPKGIFNVPERVHVQYILVKASETDPDSVKTEAKKRAGDAARRAAAGEDFVALAKQFSQDPTAARGGDIGFIPRGVRFKEFEDVAFAAKPGAISSVFETPDGYNVVKVLEKKPVSVQSFDEVKSQLMLEMGRMMEQDIVRSKVKEMAAAAKIAILDPSYMMPNQTARAATKP